MTIIEARYVGLYSVPERRTWHPFPGQKYDLRYDAEKMLQKLKRQFCELYEFRLVEL
jgi:hypothetical protein